MKNPDWVTYSAQSQKLGYGQQVAIQWLHAKGASDSAAKLRAIKYVPEGEIIHYIPGGCFYLVLQVLEAAALCWPVERSCANGYKIALGLDELPWLCITSVDDVMVRC